MARRTIGRRVVVALALSLLVSLGVTSLRQGAVGTEPGTGPFPHGIVVVGDSITARYDDDPGSETQGWWSVVGRHFDAPVRTYAQSGSGYQRPGLRCGGNRFQDRPEAFEGPAPSVFLVEGGRNDWASCRQGGFVVSTDAAVQRAVDHYLAMLRHRLPRTTRIVVLGPPWGPLDPWQQRRITSIVHTSAQRHGLEYVDTSGTLDRPGRTVDGVHPTLAGSRALGERVIDALARPAAR
jgi:lysophospholipase L1-like esterase